MWCQFKMIGKSFWNGSRITSFGQKTLFFKMSVRTKEWVAAKVHSERHRHRPQWLPGRRLSTAANWRKLRFQWDQKWGCQCHRRGHSCHCLGRDDGGGAMVLLLHLHRLSSLVRSRAPCASRAGFESTREPYRADGRWGIPAFAAGCRSSSLLHRVHLWKTLH